MEVFAFPGPVASFAPGVAEGVAVEVGVLVGVAVTSGEGLGDIGCWYLLRNQIRYPAITTKTKIATTIVTFLFKKLTSLGKQAVCYTFLLDKINPVAKSPIPIPKSPPPKTSDNQCSPK